MKGEKMIKKVYEVYIDNLSSEERSQVMGILEKNAYMAQSHISGKFIVAFFDRAPNLKTILANYNVEIKNVTDQDLIKKYYGR